MADGSASGRAGALGLHALVTADAVGGVWQYALDLASGLTARGATVTIAVLGPEPNAEQTRLASAIAGCRVVLTRLPLDWLAGSAAEVVASGDELAALADYVRADVVHLHSAALAASTRFPCPVVAVCHSCTATWWQVMRTDPMPADFVWRRDLMAAGLRSANVLIAPTAAFAELTASTYGLSPVPVVVRNGRKSGFRRLTAESASFVFTAGRLWDEAKDVGRLDRVAAQLKVPVLAAGPLVGPNLASVRLEAIRALGQVGDDVVRAHLDQGPVFCSLARYEPFGLAVLEAAQAGCALVLSDTPGFRELWDGAAVFVPPGADGAEIAGSIEAIMDDPERRRSLGAAALARSALYNNDAMTEGVLAVYRSVPVRMSGSARVAA